jgi:hypothetical protein
LEVPLLQHINELGYNVKAFVFKIHLVGALIAAQKEESTTAKNYQGEMEILFSDCFTTL